MITSIKKQFGTACFILISITSFAQSLELYHNDTLVNNDTIVIEGDAFADSLYTYIFQGDTTYYYSYEVDVDIDVKNTTTEVLDVQTKKRHIKIIPNTEDYFCWVTCYPPYTFESITPVSIQGGETTDIYSAHYKPNGHLGNTMVAYTFFDNLNPHDSAMLVVEYKMDDLSFVEENDKYKDDFSKPYPNPAQHTLYLNHYKSNEKNFTMIIYNPSGYKVKEIDFNTQQSVIQIDIKDLRSGLYIYSIFSKDIILSFGKFTKSL